MSENDAARADLHLHSNHSDGDLSPQQIMLDALKRGLTAISITDHEVISGFLEARALLDDDRFRRLSIIPGVEITAHNTSWTNKAAALDCDILGYFIDPDNQLLQGHAQRVVRNKQKNIVETLLAVNAFLEDICAPFQIEPKDIFANSPNGNVSRSHVARALKGKNRMENDFERRRFDKAVFQLLGKETNQFKEIVKACVKMYGRKYSPSAETYSLDTIQAIELIKRAKGIPILAHPITVFGALEVDSLEYGDAVEKIQALKALGIAGLEVISDKHTQQQAEVYKRIALSLGLLLTGGSDDHGRGDRSRLTELPYIPYSWVSGLINSIRH